MDVFHFVLGLCFAGIILFVCLRACCEVFISLWFLVRVIALSILRVICFAGPLLLLVGWGLSFGPELRLQSNLIVAVGFIVGIPWFIHMTKSKCECSMHFVKTKLDQKWKELWD